MGLDYRTPFVPDKPVRRETHDREDDVIQQLCEVLSLREGTEVKIVGHPDREAPGQGGSDAILERQGIRWAAEHTRVGTRPELPGHLAILNRFRDRIVSAIAAAFPTDVVTVSLPTEEFVVGADWSAMIDDLLKEAIQVLPTLEVDSGWQIGMGTYRNPPVVYLHSRGDKQGICGVIFRRPHDSTDLIRADMLRAIKDKRGTLRRYKTGGMSTILILEAPEIGWPNDFVGAFVELLPSQSVDVFDEIFLACSLSNPIWFVPLKLGTIVPVGQPYYSEFVDLWEKRRRREELRSQ